MSVDQEPLLEPVSENITNDVPNTTSTSYATRDITRNTSSVTANYFVTIVHASLNSLAHVFNGASVFVALWFAFKSAPVTAFQWHIGLSIIGYQVLMAQGLLALSKSNGWSSQLRYLHKMRSHWIMQLLGSILAIAGSAIMIRSKTTNFNSIHGKLALAALIFTCISLTTGLTSLYTVKLKKYIPPSLSKTFHVVLGTAAFILSSVCLGFGYNKKSFREWATVEMSYVITVVTAIYAALVCVSPLTTCWRKLHRVVKNKVF